MATQEIKRTKYLHNVGWMYINNLGVEMYETTSDKHYMLMPYSMRGQCHLRDENNKKIKRLITKERFENEIASKEIAAWRLQAALKICGINLIDEDEE